METMDFSKIRGQSDGQRYSFEGASLPTCAQRIARYRIIVQKSGRFRRRRRCRGLLGLLPGGSKYGYQAKDFTRARDIDWAQIDDSVYQALRNHPSLTRYVIAIPCDLTDRSGATGKGRTGWEHWETHKRKWLARSRRRHPKIDFLAWTAFELQNLNLFAQSADGLRRYWFGNEEFSPPWFAHHVARGDSRLG